MSTVYISSTFRDLQICRATVAVAVRLLGHQDVAMEHYGAEPRPPIDKCLDDVARSDIYIGIVARRYGWVPPGYAHSITEEEYGQAVRTRKPILIFVLQDSAECWPEVGETEEQQVALKEFRERLLKEQMCASFESCDVLERKIFASLANLNAAPSTPYDHAREDQMFDLLGGTDKATKARARRQLVDMGSAAYAAELRRRLRRGRAEPEERTEDVRELAEIENKNHQVTPILRDLLEAEDPATLAAVVWEFAQRGLQKKPVSDDDIRAILKLGTHPSDDVRREVGHAMWKFLPRPQELRDEMIEVLLPLGREENLSIQRTANYSIRQIWNW
jgi:hypothetical protein